MFGSLKCNKWFGTFRQRSARSKYNYHSQASFQCYACTQAAGAPDSAAHNLSPPPKLESATGKHPSAGLFPTIFDPRSKRVKKWNRYILLARGIALAIDPLFFYALSIGQNGSTCLMINWNVVTVVTIIRTCVDAVHLSHMWLQLRLAYVSKESLVIGCGRLVWDSKLIAAHYFQSFHGFWFDIIVILPFPQVVFWLVVHRLIMKQRIELMMSIILLVFLIQFVLKVFHFLSLMKRMKKVTGNLFGGSIRWGFSINILAYFIASHVSGGCWYMLGIQRVASCLRDHSNGHNFSLSCSHSSSTAPFIASMCFDENGTFPYGIYGAALQVISSSSIIVKILYPINWGLMMLSQVGNPLAPTSNLLELIFSIYMVLVGFMLFTLMIGNIQVFLHAIVSRKRKMEQRGRDLEWWMRWKRLPSHLVQRVRRYETLKWRSIHGEDEMEFIAGLPQGLRRDIKRFLCLDLIKKVPLFHNMDDLILENICDRVKALVFSKDEKIIREGDPVHMIIFIVRGRVKSCQKLSRGREATSNLEPGGYLGDELLSWSLRRPFIERLPASAATFTCLETTEAFALDANNLLYIADHFRRKFNQERLKGVARYYSSNWRTWAAVTLQIAWRRRRERMISGPMNRDYRLRRYAAVFMSMRPRDHLDT